MHKLARTRLPHVCTLWLRLRMSSLRLAAPQDVHKYTYVTFDALPAHTSVERSFRAQEGGKWKQFHQNTIESVLQKLANGVGKQLAMTVVTWHALPVQWHLAIAQLRKAGSALCIASLRLHCIALPLAACSTPALHCMRSWLARSRQGLQ